MGLFLRFMIYSRQLLTGLIIDAVVIGWLDLFFFNDQFTKNPPKFNS